MAFSGTNVDQLLAMSEGKKMKRVSIGKYVIGCTMVATLSSILLGYDGGVISGAILFIRDEFRLKIIELEMIVGSLSIVSIFGAVAAGRLSDAIGRRMTMAIAAVIFFVGAGLMALAPNFAVLLLGRVIAGIGVGFALMVAPVYAAELAPARIRGCLVSLIEVFINVGVLLGYIANFALERLPSNINWRLMLGLGAFPAILLGLGVLVMPESPRWLVTQGRLAEAKDVLLKTSNGDEEEAKSRLTDIMEVIGLDHNSDPSREEHEATAATVGVKKQGEGVWHEILYPTRYVKRLLIAALGVHFFQQACGIDAIVSYSPVVFSEAGIKSRLGTLGATIGVGLSKVTFIFVATAFLDQYGRKPLLIISGASMSLCLIAVSVAFITLGLNSTKGVSLFSSDVGTTQKAPAAGAAITILFICSYVGCFSIGFGPIVWVLISEMFPLRIRAQACGLAAAMNRIVSGTVTLTFLSISKAITPAGAFFLYSAIGFTSVLFVIFFVPETKGKTLEELQKFFEGKGVEVNQGTEKHAIELGSTAHSL